METKIGRKRKGKDSEKEEKASVDLSVIVSHVPRKHNRLMEFTSYAKRKKNRKKKKKKKKMK